MKAGLVVYILWFVVMFASLVLAGLHVSRRKPQGLKFSFLAIIGALLTWAFVSAFIGAMEVDDYTGTRAFALSVFLGFVGLLSLFKSVRAITM